MTNSTRGLGPVAAIGILVALAAMLTLLPALLVTFGRWVFWPARPREGSAEPTTTGFWARVGTRIAHAPRPTWIVTTLVLAVAGARADPARRHRPVQQGVLHRHAAVGHR